MRRYVRIGLLATSALLALLAGCKPQITLFDAGNYIGGTATADATVRDNLSATGLQEYQDAYFAGGYSVTVSSWAPGSLTALAGQRLSIGFANGVIDEDTIASGILLWALEANEDPDGAANRGSALALSVIAVLPDGAGGCTVVVEVDLDGATLTNWLELEVKADVLTANGGTNRLNLDGDGDFGEATEDDYVNYIALNGAPVAFVSGNNREPQATLADWDPGNFSVGGTTITTNVQNTDGTTSSMTGESLTAGFVWRRFVPSDGSWTAVATTADYNEGTGLVTWTFPDAFETGDLFRFEADRYETTESESVNGYIHRNSYNQNDPDQRYYYGYRGAVRTTALADIASSGPRADGTADLSGGHDWSTTNESFWFSANGAAAVEIDLTTNEANLNNVVAALNAVLPAGYTAAGWDSDLDGTNESVRITGTATGSDEYFTLTAEDTGDALATLGMAEGTYVGKDAWSGTVSGVLRSSQSDTDYARWIEINFSAPVDATTIAPDSVVVLDDSNNTVPWVDTGLIALTDTRVRISFPSSFRGNGSYRVRVYPTVLATDGVPFADTGVDGTRSGIGDLADFPYLESDPWDWD